MTLLPDFFTIDIYNLPDVEESLIRNGKIMYALGFDNSTLCYGTIEDIYSHVEGANDVISVSISDGQEFWDAKVNKTISAGVRIKETIAAILKGAVIGSYLADNPRLVRGQTLSGSLPQIVQNMASGVNARAFISHGAVHIVGKGQSNDVVTVRDDEIISVPGYANGVCIAYVKVKGFAVGSMIYFKDGYYRLVAQAVDADNFNGTWQTQLILVDESQVENMGGW